MTEREQEPNLTSDIDDTQRRGVAPFASGIKKENTILFDIIASRPIPFGDLGEVSLILSKPNFNEYVNHDALENDRAFTILSGKIKKGRLFDFTKNGYYTVAVSVDPYNYQAEDNLNVNIWIDNTSPLVTAGLEAYDDTIDAHFNTYDPNTGIIEEFVLPGNPKILKAVRINVSSQ